MKVILSIHLLMIVCFSLSISPFFGWNVNEFLTYIWYILYIYLPESTCLTHSQCGSSNNSNNDKRHIIKNVWWRRRTTDTARNTHPCINIMLSFRCRMQVCDWVRAACAMLWSVHVRNILYYVICLMRVRETLYSANNVVSCGHRIERKDIKVHVTCLHREEMGTLLVIVFVKTLCPIESFCLGLAGRVAHKRQNSTVDGLERRCLFVCYCSCSWAR